MVLWPPPQVSRPVQKSRQFLGLEDDAPSTVCLQVSRRVLGTAGGRKGVKDQWKCVRWVHTQSSGIQKCLKSYLPKVP